MRVLVVIHLHPAIEPCQLSRLMETMSDADWLLKDEQDRFDPRSPIQLKQQAAATSIQKRRKKKRQGLVETLQQWTAQDELRMEGRTGSTKGSAINAQLHVSMRSYESQRFCRHLRTWAMVYSRLERLS